MPPTKTLDSALDSYYKTLAALRDGQGAEREGSLRRAFGALLKDISALKKWELVEEDAQRVQNGQDARTIYYDGVLRDEWRLPHGWWEAKDSRDDLDKAIRLKREKGYSFKNMLFEDTQTLVLFQDGLEVGRTPIEERQQMARLLQQFLNYEIAPFDSFQQAIAYFSAEIPTLAQGLKARIDAAHRDNKAFQTAYAAFMTLCQQALNPNISAAAVDEMLIQHMLTERLMRKLFDEDFARHNVIAHEVEQVITALTSASFNRTQFLGSLDRFYAVIEDAAAELATFADKQAFINTVYERFFQGYSVKTADTHGIVYTPQAIVDFMCAATEEVLHDEFGLELGEEGAMILDPATGTGNFIVNLLGRVSERHLDDFYKQRLFANEVMLMPYYIASLNIEATYYQRRQRRQPFEGMCFVDTLDMDVGLRTLNMFSEANTARVERQKHAPITVVIGNPPYNVGQVNENDNNKNRAYKQVDARIRATYAKDSRATLKMQLYDMYVRFFRWAVDRLGGRDGVVVYVTNNSFVDQVAFDGFRKHLLQDFTRVYHLDLHGNVRQNPKLSGTTHNVFGIQVGVGITVAIRSQQHTERQLFYHRVPEDWTKAQKLEFLAQHVALQGRHNALNTIPWRTLTPDSKHNWLLESSAAWEAGLPIGSKAGKATRGREPETIFRLYSRGVATSRDDTVYDWHAPALTERVQRFIEAYNAEVDRYRRAGKPKDVDGFVKTTIKWDGTLKADLVKGKYAAYEPSHVRRALYRPFTPKSLYFDRMLNNSVYLQHRFFPTPATEQENRVIGLADAGSEKPFMVLMSQQIMDLHLVGAGSATQCFPFYTYDEDGSNRRENITDWALEQFQAHYDDPTISKWDVFYYVYALLHHPQYRQQFAAHLKKELPRVPFLGSPSPLGEGAGVRAVARIGQRLAELHLGYETGPRARLTWQTSGTLDYRVSKMKRVGNSIVYNHTLTLADIPASAWGYKLGSRSALEWLIDQYQVKKDKAGNVISDPNAASDDPQHLVKLIERVAYLSAETVRLVEALGAQYAV